AYPLRRRDIPCSSPRNAGSATRTRSTVAPGPGSIHRMPCHASPTRIENDRIPGVCIAFSEDPYITLCHYNVFVAMGFSVAEYKGPPSPFSHERKHREGLTPFPVFASLLPCRPGATRR